MTKTQTNIRMSDLTRQQIADLTRQTGMNLPEIVAIAIDRMYQQETRTMNHTFKTFADAYAAGYRRVSHNRDKDISGGNWQGYDYQSPDGQRTVTVWLTDEPNQMGKPGCFCPMYPPQQPTD